MRKVFLSEALMSTPTEDPRAVIHQSRDLDLGDKQYIFPISYLLDAHSEPGDEILIATGLSQGENRLENYRLLQQEARQILDAHGATAKFVAVNEPDYLAERDMQDSLSVGAYLKDVSDLLADGDRIYADMTYGQKYYTLAMFIAIGYAVKACRDVEVRQLIYANFYRGSAQTPNTADIIDITSLFRLNNIVGNALPGQKGQMDQLLSFVIG